MSFCNNILSSFSDPEATEMATFIENGKKYYLKYPIACILSHRKFIMTEKGKIKEKFSIQ